MQETKAVAVRESAIEPFRRALAHAQESFRLALPSTVAKYLTPERLTKITLAAISRSPLLLECTPESVLRSVMDAASLGLEPTGGVLGHAYLVPYKNGKTGKREAQLIVGYRGFIDLARRSEKLEDIEAHVVHANDTLVLEYGREPKLEHRPCLIGEAGDAVGAYCVATLAGGRKHCEWMSIDEIERVRDRSRARDSGPWQTDFEEMAKKTVVRRCAKYLPMSTELVRALESEDAAEDGVTVTETQVLALAPPAEVEKPKTSRIAEKAKANLEAAKVQDRAKEPEPAEERDWSQVGPAPMPEPGSNG